MCFHDESWPVRDEACLACGTFCLAYADRVFARIAHSVRTVDRTVTDQVGFFFLFMFLTTEANTFNGSGVYVRMLLLPLETPSPPTDLTCLRKSLPLSGRAYRRQGISHL